MIESRIIVQNPKSFFVNAPTIKTMIEGLQALQEGGVDPDENLMISQLANGAGCFMIATLQN
jgi:hypothetical protein